ncbi:MAG: segregation/condensation protein A [Planctomycetota bacterium]
MPGSDAPVDAALVERLLLYRRLRAAGEFLAAAADDASRTFVRRASDRPEVETPAADRVRGLEVWDVVAAYVRATPPPETAAAAGAVRRDAVPVADVVRDLGRRVRARGPVTLGEFVGAAASRERLIATFLAVLELVRHHRFRVVQTGDAADIEVVPPADEASIAPAA